jgi:pimeloyl-ACP methyl ester carboxylesterase
MNIELVNTATSDAVQLHGYLRQPEATAAAEALGFDLVICHHGVGDNFYNSSFFDVMGEALLERGCAVLRVNNRGHDQAYLSGQRRLGAAYEIVDDCRLDFTAWLDFAEQRGFGRVAIWGHSLGAVKTIYFMSVQDDPRIACALASSPPRFSYSMYRSSTNGERFAATIEEAQSLVASGKSEATLEAVVPVARSFSARTLVDKYGPEARYDYFEHLPKVRKPLLLTLGSLESDNVSFAPLAQQGPSFAQRWTGVEYREITGADHSYQTRTRELWSAVSDWLAQSTRSLLSEATPQH